MKWEACIDLIYPWGHVQTVIHRAPFAWVARVFCWCYEYGPAFMPLIGRPYVGMTIVRRRAA